MRHESIDTNVVLRALIKDLPEQSAKVDNLLKMHHVRYFISDIAVFESVYALEKYYHLQREHIVILLTSFLLQQNISCNHELINNALAHYRTHQSLSYADCYLAASATFMNATPLWTFDRDLVKKLPGAKLVE